MSILYGATCIVGIIFMTAFLFIGIWLFITALKAYNQLRYKNYILEKIYEKISNISEACSSGNNENTSNSSDLFDVTDNEKISHINSRKDFN